MTLTLTVRDQNEFDSSEVQSTLAGAIDRELAQAIARRDYYANECRAFEERYNMSSETYLRAFEAGDLGDDQYLFIWFGAKQALDLWERRVRLLSGVTVELQ